MCLYPRPKQSQDISDVALTEALGRFFLWCEANMKTVSRPDSAVLGGLLVCGSTLPFRQNGVEFATHASP